LEASRDLWKERAKQREEQLRQFREEWEGAKNASAA
jgi:hypothetical protein